MFKKILLLIVAVNISSCSYFEKKNEVDTRKPIARVENSFLYKEDIVDFLPANYKQQDSALLVNNYINSWAKKQLLLSKARFNLNAEIAEINKLVTKYKEDLLINKYREAVVQQNIDTVVSETDIDEFYLKNKGTFKLNESLLKLKFIHADKTIIDRAKIEKLFKSDKQKDVTALVDKELEFKSFYFNDSVWIKYNDVIKNIPLLKKKDLAKITKSKYLVKEDSLDFYIIKINKVLPRNSISPKSYLLPTIKQMILHTRKLKLLKEIERTLLNDANKNGKYEIYK